jgi:hypothetical protein
LVQTQPRRTIEPRYSGDDLCTSCALHLGDGCVLVRIGPPPFSYFIYLMSPTQATAHILCSPFSLTGGEFAWRDSIGRGSLCKHFSRDEVASSGGDDPPGWRLGARAFRRWGVARAGRGDGFDGGTPADIVSPVSSARKCGSSLSAASPDFRIRFDAHAAIGRFRSFQHRSLRKHRT